MSRVSLRIKTPGRSGKLKNFIPVKEKKKKEKRSFVLDPCWGWVGGCMFCLPATKYKYVERNLHIFLT